MIGAFSTRPPAMAFIPGVRLVLSLATVHQLLSVRCSTPRDYGRSDKNNTHCELYGGLIMLTSRTTAPPPLPISERLHWNIACSGNCLPPACCPIVLPSVVWLGGVHLHAVQYVGRTYTAPLMGARMLHCNLSTRREISGSIGKHSKPPPDIRRRSMHSIEGALI